jgi:hypothetical protein
LSSPSVTTDVGLDSGVHAQSNQMKSEAKTEHTQKARWNQLVTLGRSNCLISVVWRPRDYAGFLTWQLCDRNWASVCGKLSFYH